MTPKLLQTYIPRGYALKGTERVSFNKSPYKKLPKDRKITDSSPQVETVTVPREFWTHWAGLDLHPSPKLRMASWERERLFPKKTEDVVTKRSGA